jgi:hypothetical protein
VTRPHFSGPRFINTVKEFEPYFPDYNQFIEQRNKEGKSTSRKIYYYDILIGLKENVKLEVINRLLEILKPFQKEKVNKIEELLGKTAVNKEEVTVPNVKRISINPIIFISYSWDNEEHKEWVLNLANRLCSDGVDVILDRYYLKPGKNLPHFVEDSISKAERIIIVFTPNYKLKADNRAGGVGYEYSIMNADLYNNQTTNEKVIPILRGGNIKESIPTFMQQFVHIDTRNNENFENSYSDLVREIFDEPAIQKPKLGIKPSFQNEKSGEVEKPEVGNGIDMLAKVKNELPLMGLESTVFFSYRIANAFPGERSLVWYNEPKIIVERLAILLGTPLKFGISNKENFFEIPIWWYRGSSSMHIENFEKLTKTKVLIGIKELEVKRMAVNIDSAYYKCFVYLETKAEKPTGLYDTNENVIKRDIETFGYSWEEFGLLGKQLIRREEYEDGAAVIKSKVVDASSAKLRTRFLSDYNLLIAAHDSPYNSDKFERYSEDFFNGILTNKITTEFFFEFLSTFKKKEW